MSPLTNDVGPTVELGELNVGPNVLIHSDSAGNADGIADVAAGQVLTSIGATSKPAWAAPSSVMFPKFHFYADQFDNPDDADWALATDLSAPAVADSINAGLTVRRFDDTVEEGVGFPLRVPTGAVNIKFTFMSRAQASGGGNVVPKIYEREIQDAGAPTAFSTGNDLTALVFGTNTNFNEDTETVTLASLGLAAGQIHQIELTRNVGAGGDTLTGDWDLFEIVVEFT